MVTKSPNGGQQAGEAHSDIRGELQLAVAAIVDDGLSPLLEVVANFEAKQGNLLATLADSVGAMVDSQARIERALADATGASDDNEPWRESLHDDARLDDD